METFVFKENDFVWAKMAGKLFKCRLGSSE